MLLHEGSKEYTPCGEYNGVHGGLPVCFLDSSYHSNFFTTLRVVCPMALGLQYGMPNFWQGVRVSEKQFRPGNLLLGFLMVVLCVYSFLNTPLSPSVLVPSFRIAKLLPLCDAILNEP